MAVPLAGTLPLASDMGGVSIVTNVSVPQMSKLLSLATSLCEGLSPTAPAP